MIPDFYEPHRQEEMRQARWDAYLAKLPTCTICGYKIMEGEDVHESRGKHVCAGCLEELIENTGYVEVD